LIRLIHTGPLVISRKKNRSFAASAHGRLWQILLQKSEIAW
jgi:hypothetical protein